MELRKLQKKLLKELDKVSETKCLDFIAGWFGWEYLWDILEDSINNYDDVVVLEDALKELKK